MEKWQLAQEEAKKNIAIADHMMNVTYKLINDPKLLLSIIARINSALTLSLQSVLHFERYYKRIPPFHDSFEAMYNVFKTRITSKYHINIEHLTLLNEVNAIVRQHKESAMEFTRQDKLIICGDNYGMKILSEDKIKNYIKKSKLFIQEMENMVSLT